MEYDLEEVTYEAWLVMVIALRGSALVHRGAEASMRLAGFVDLRFDADQGFLRSRDGQRAET